MPQTVYYWRGSAEVRQDVIAALLSANFRVVQLRTLEDILDRIDADDPFLLIVDGSAGNREAAGRVIELAGTAKLFSLSVIFISQQAKRRTETLSKSFVRLIPIEVPYRVDSILFAAQTLSTNPEDISKVKTFIALGGAPEAGESRGETKPQPASPEAEPGHTPQAEPQTELPAPPEPAPPPERAEQRRAEEHPHSAEETVLAVPDDRGFPAPAPAPASNAHAAGPAVEKTPRRSKRRVLQDNTAQIRQRMNARPDPAKLNDSHGGEAFAIARDPADFVDDLLIPAVSQKEKILQLLRKCEEKDRMLAAHCKRLAFVASAMANTLSLGQERDFTIRVAALFLNWSVFDRPARLIRHDLIGTPSETISQELARCYRQSASFVKRELDHAGATDTISAVANLLSGADTSGIERDILVNAEIVLGVELSTRSCWGMGFWNPTGAHRTIRYLRGESSLLPTADIRNCLIRVLGESVTAHITVGNTFDSLVDPDIALMNTELKMREAEASAAAAEKAAERAKEAGVKTIVVPIADLQPGMLLLEPVIARDGRLVLDANIVLNEEIVYGLWQLAAVRALQGKVGVAVRESGFAR